jgi:type II secretory pathway pseudopilin PulG
MNCRVQFYQARACAAQRGFTMVEIAIALGVIGFALVAIIGILPMGLEVQRDNRSETIINQDATFWAEAIRNGSTGLDDLTNHVENIQIVEWDDIFARNTILNSNYYVFQAGPSGYLNGSNIVGLLTSRAANANLEVRALVSAVSGSASEKGPDAADRELGFRYRLNVDIYSPGTNTPSFSELSVNQGIPESDILDHLYELRLSLSYPVVNEDRPAPRRQVFRTSIARGLLQLTNQTPAHYFFIP